jgi:RimJ/RimL family protein N-acetyltransferase
VIPSNQQRFPHEKLRLRAATFDDADLLLRWRNDPETRKWSRDNSEVPWIQHVEWVRNSLANSDRRILIAELDGTAIGTVRVDYSDGQPPELSWTVAPEARGRGFGKLMVTMAANGLETARAVVKAGNEASKAIAESAGFVLHFEEDGMLHYQKEKQPQQ